MRPVALLLVAQLGCSFVFLDKPPRPAPRNETPSCAIESVLPAIDVTAFGVGFLTSLLSLAFLTKDAFGCCDRLTRDEAIGITGGVGVVAAYGISGVYGMHQVHRCRRMHALGPPHPAED